MLNERIEIEIYGRKLLVEMEGLDPLQVHQLAKAVSERMEEISRDSKVVDTQKLAVLTALDFAAENIRLKTQLEETTLVEERRIDAMTLALQKAIESAPEKS